MLWYMGEAASRGPPRGSRPAAWGWKPSLLRQHLCALKIKVEPNLGQTSFAHGVPQPHLVLNVEHEKAAPTRTNQLATNRPVLQCKIVPCVNLRVRHIA